tara:strand:- start:12702 stop:13445 length:744 start_codon:yes stop_codon:yes gene_type:complete
MNKQEILTQLCDDSHYYGEFGSKYLSNSVIGILLSNPQMFGQKREDDKALALGRLFHQLLLEPEKAELSMELCVDVASRNTKVYREFCEQHQVPFALLCKEVDDLVALTKKMTSNIEFYDDIYAEGNKFEVPEVGTILGAEWKGKADILCADRIIDIKTTGDIHKFRHSAYRYNYDSQAYIYGELFGRPLEFYVIDKSSGQLGKFIPTEDFLQSGMNKVKRALEVYNKYFSSDAANDVNDHYILESL